MRSRREVLRTGGAALVAYAAGKVGRKPPRGHPDGGQRVTAERTIRENARRGTTEWTISGAANQDQVAAFSDRVSAGHGERVTMFIHTTDQRVRVQAFRMGWYQGLGARLIWSSPWVAGHAQPPSVLLAPTNTVQCHWSPSLEFKVASSWPPGAYLMKVIGSSGQARYVPFVVRDDSSRSAFIVQTSVTTYQAYNWWGGYSLYYGAPGADGPAPESGQGSQFDARARMVSFDRPYPHDWSYGAADFIGNELPLVMLVERLGLDVDYWTDVDLHRYPRRLMNHRCLISLGHDEYWSAPMYDGALAARDSGVNFMFLGANACYRHIRLQSSPVGEHRHQVCYKVAGEDPNYGHDASQVTCNWPDAPLSRPESLLIGNMYQANPVKADMVVVNSGSWVFQGSGLKNGHHLVDLVGPEYDGLDLAVAGPRNIEILAHSPVEAGGVPGYADMTWYTAGKAGGVFSTGTNWWVNRLADNRNKFNMGLVSWPTTGVTDQLIGITTNVLKTCGAGPGGLSRPSNPNWMSFYPGAGTASNRRTYWPA